MLICCFLEDDRKYGPESKPIVTCYLLRLLLLQECVMTFFSLNTELYKDNFLNFSLIIYVDFFYNFLYVLLLQFNYIK